ncbi:tRNA pseudouridine(54/55) synthase Pus10 [Candidatus Poseidoniales archaeon]|nr:tRNA pseudouridine(54/55) synthase Pus10 [Candidatus Poseidoniales archaeon]|tara:strand:- start:5180 stop:6892 length:1713 start_codon:yes stop_codon:yes gene_type:complete
MVDKTTPDDDEDWMQYANSGFGSTDYSLWDEVEEQKMEGGQSDEPEQLDSHTEEISRAPSPAGLKHLLRMGTCDSCLGRLGGKRSFQQTDEESGQLIRSTISEGNERLLNIRQEIPLCPFCENLFEEASLLAELIQDALESYKINKLQIGARIPKDQIEQEELIRKRYGAGGSDPFKPSLVSAVSSIVKSNLDSIDIVNDKPDVLALIDVLTLTVTLDVRSAYIYGRYRKLARGIPQTRWPCRACKGRGCQSCEQTGQQYPSSVQDLIGEPLIKFFDGKEHAFHGMGREDIDVRCLGSGRPFVFEIKEPKRWSIDYEEAMALVNKEANGAIEISHFRSSNRSEVVRVKDTPAEKSYTIRFIVEPISQPDYDVLVAPLDMTKEDVQQRGGRGRKKHRRRGDKKDNPKKPLQKIEVKILEESELKKLKKDDLVALCEERSCLAKGTKAVLIEQLLSTNPEPVELLPLPSEAEILEIVEKLEGVNLAQRTPERVAHRRADLVRRRRVIETNEPNVETLENGNIAVEFTLRCESGTYVKETIHGDDGRTQPSMASLIKAKCTVEWLDVGDIHAD